LAAFIVWACYLFTFAPLFSAHELQVRSADFSPALTRPGLVHTVVTQIPVPAGQFFRGIGQVWRHNKGGQWSYLLGQRSDSGWWYFFPVVLAIKTPLGFLVLAAAGAVLMLGRLRYGDWRTAAPAIFAILVLLICMPGRLNIGVRHILPMYPMLSIAAGYCAAEWTGARGRLRKTLAAACVAWCCVASLRAHPDYLASFNEIASWRPEYFRVDSDLDWGQDLGRLRDRLRDLHATSVTLSYFGSADLTRFGLPPFTDITCDGQLHGYVAISATALYLGRPVWSGCPDRFYALQRMPSKRVGDSIFLYHFP
jgi:hypothetical protein